MTRLSEAFASVGVKVRYEFMPWNRAMKLTRVGKYVATPLWLKTTERERDFSMIGPIENITFVIFHRRGRPIEWTNLTDLRGVKLGFSNGYFYGPDFDRMASDGTFSIDRAPTDEQNLNKLAHGRIDGFPMDREVGEYLIGLANDPAVREGLTFNPKPIHVGPTYLLVSRKHPAAESLIRRFNSAWPNFRLSNP
ncbi:substrate-binding periplasmic protein [Chitinimonas sp. PSY-7]|uniref:substrate-binding periplasmic protein n=1 Tax=Chitinimonas sp. PSY-7 TaxID=3459088 RepID=UPI0040401703